MCRSRRFCRPAATARPLSAWQGVAPPAWSIPLLSLRMMISGAPQLEQALEAVGLRLITRR